MRVGDQMGDKRNGRLRVTEKNKKPEMKKIIQVTVKNNPSRGLSMSPVRIKVKGKTRGTDHLIDIAAKQFLTVERPECVELEIRTPSHDIKHDIDIIEEKYYSSNAAVDRIMSRKFRELVQIYVKRQVDRIAGHLTARLRMD